MPSIMRSSLSNPFTQQPLLPVHSGSLLSLLTFLLPPNSCSCLVLNDKDLALLHLRAPSRSFSVPLKDGQNLSWDHGPCLLFSPTLLFLPHSLTTNPVTMHAVPWVYHGLKRSCLPQAHVLKSMFVACAFILRSSGGFRRWDLAGGSRSLRSLGVSCL
jgi:hypothetical protein